MTITFLREYIKPTKNSDTIAYARNLPRAASKYLKDKFNKKADSLHSYEGDSLILTESEKKYIRNELDRLMEFNWSISLFNKSKVIEGEKVWDALEKKKLREVNVFSKPIFLRNNSFFLFYHIHFKGLGGPSYFGFFRQVDGQWRPWITISSGVLN